MGGAERYLQACKIRDSCIYDSVVSIFYSWRVTSIYIVSHLLLRLPIGHTPLLLVLGITLATNSRVKWTRKTNEIAGRVSVYNLEF